jgi:hypothetical protein
MYFEIEIVTQGIHAQETFILVTSKYTVETSSTIMTIAWQEIINFVIRGGILVNRDMKIAVRMIYRA